MSDQELQALARLGQLSASGVPTEEVEALAEASAQFDAILDLFGMGDSGAR